MYLAETVFVENVSRNKAFFIFFFPLFLLLFSWPSGLRILPCGVAKVRGALGQEEEEEEEEDLLSDPQGRTSQG